MTTPETQHRTVRFMTRKWPDSPHWEFDTVRLGADAHGYWLGLPQGTWMSRPGVGMPAAAPHVVLLPHDGWYLAGFYGDDPQRPFDTYIDVTTPWSWNHDQTEIRAVDLDLDVIKGTAGRVWIDDEDEFAEHQRTLGYPAEVVSTALETAEMLLESVTDEAPPFDGTHLGWLARLRALTS